ncbi:MAG: putative lipid II flippase FtsW [Bacilli bacterium]
MDLVLLVAIVVLSLIGLMMVFSASNVVAEAKYGNPFYYFTRQLFFLILGFILMLFIINVNIIKYQNHVVTVFLVCFALLLLVLIPGIGKTRGGARSWIAIGNFSIQPSEFMKLGLAGIYAKYLGAHYRDMKSLKNFLLLFSLAVVVFLIIMLQPDFGTGLVIVVSAGLMIYLAGVPVKYFVIIVSIGLFGAAFLILSAPYRIERIMAFLNPWEDPLGSGFQGIQSLFAITPGGFFGHGFNKSMQKHFFLPEPQNDFIFAILLEEFGLIGGAVVLSLYFVILYRSFLIALSVEDNFLRFLVLGIAVSFAVQVAVNVCVVIGILPVTGITLPLFSYGGSSLVLTLVSLGIIVSASRHRNYDFD